MTAPTPSRAPASGPSLGTEVAVRPVSLTWSSAVDASRAATASPSRRWERAVLLAFDALALNLAFYLAWYARYRLELIVELDPGNYVAHDVYLLLQLALSAVIVATLALRGLYRVPRATSALEDLSPIFAATGLGIMVVFALSTFVRYPAESRLTLIFMWVLGTVLVLFGRALYLMVVGLLRRRGIGVARTLVVGDNTAGRMIMQSLAARPHLGYEVVGFLANDSTDDFGRFRWLGHEDGVEHVIREQGICQVMIALPSTSHEAIMRIVDHCRRDGVEFRVVPDLYEMSLGRVDLDTVSGLPLLGLKQASITGFNFFLKRAIDVTLGAILLLLSALVIVPTAIAIKLEDRGPVFFGQVRVGRGRREFKAWKLRSMVENADDLLPELLDQNETAGPIFKKRDDPRRTRVGRFLRRWSLDELPQFWNVLVGDMSLVGPRPPTPREVALYEEWHLQRLAVPPGITGLWQVSGRSELGGDEMILLDITYIENWSIGLDLRILLRTIPAVLSGKGAF